MLHYSEEDSNIYTAIALIANDAEDTVNLLLAWTESICVVSEPYTVVTKIDSTEDWNDLLYSQNYSEKYLSLIAAFLNGDTKTFSSLTLVDEGDYRDFAFPNISRYSIMMDV